MLRLLPVYWLLFDGLPLLMRVVEATTSSYVQHLNSKISNGMSMLNAELDLSFRRSAFHYPSLVSLLTAMSHVVCVFCAAFCLASLKKSTTYLLLSIKRFIVNPCVNADLLLFRVISYNGYVNQMFSPPSSRQT